jgi:hypothetical protein
MTMNTELARAKIIEVNVAGEPVGGITVDCMFNPAEYTVSKSNQYSEWEQVKGTHRRRNSKVLVHKR